MEITIDMLNDFDNYIKSIPERYLFINYVEYANKTYTFYTVGYLLFDGKPDNTLDIELSISDVKSIRGWFFDRNKKWFSYVPKSFRDYNPDLYDRLYTALVEKQNKSDIDYDSPNFDEKELEPLVYDPAIDPCSEDASWEPLHWPHQLFKEMKINEPNASIWIDSPDHKYYGGFPIYIEEQFLDELKRVLDEYIFNAKAELSYLNIDDIAIQHAELHDKLIEATRESLIYTYDYDEKVIDTLKLSLYEYSLKLDVN